MKQNKLRARWSKQEQDIFINWPLGCGTVCDGGYIAGIFDKDFIKEMKDRGYDITSLKFEIKVDLNGAEAPDRFPTLYKEHLELNK